MEPTNGAETFSLIQNDESPFAAHRVAVRPMGDSVARSMSFISKLLLFSITALRVWGCTPKESTGGFSQNQNEPASAVLEQFLDEYYRERVGNLTAFLDKYTDWPDFGPGDSVKVASEYSIRKLKETRNAAQFEVTFKVIGEESLGKIEVTDGQDTEIYNVERRQNGWRIVEPINMPYISVTGEIEALRKFDESASASLQARQFTIVEPEEYFRSVRENVRKLLQVLERRK